jgi:probable aminopeptidase NPEPL1
MSTSRDVTLTFRRRVFLFFIFFFLTLRVFLCGDLVWKNHTKNVIYTHARAHTRSARGVAVVVQEQQYMLRGGAAGGAFSSVVVSFSSRSSFSRFVHQRRRVRAGKHFATKTSSGLMSANNANNHGGRYHATSSDQFQTPTLKFDNSSKAFSDDVGKKQLFDRLSFIGKPKALETLFREDETLAKNVDEKTMKLIEAFLESAKKEKASSTVIQTGTRENEKKKTVVQEIAIGVLPTQVSRHNDASGAHGLQEIAKGTCGDGKTRRVVIASENESDFGSLVNALTRAFPVFSMKSKGSSSSEKEEETKPEPMVVALSGASEATSKKAKAISEAVELACRMVDTPPTSMDPQGMVDEALAAAKRVGGVKSQVWRDKELRRDGMGCIAAVGQSASTDGREPALIRLTFVPKGVKASERPIALVGKGISFDTGGLSLKVGGSMPGMKADMGGAAAMLGAFEALAKCSTEGTITLKQPLELLMCVAENAIGSGAIRNDDVITSYAGKTVELNNTDAEGRLVLADGVSYASKTLNATHLIDMATLTGAQMVATGSKFSGIVCNDDDFELLAVKCGKVSGDLAHPLPFAPEFFNSEFDSKVADMKNSVKNRANAQSSCAAQFVYNHVDDEWKEKGGKWLHVDMAGPSTHDSGRGTGYGVGLLVSLVEELNK